MSNVKSLDNKASKFRTISEIMSMPSYKAILTNCVDEAVECKRKIANEQQIIKDLREAVVEQIGLKPEFFNQYVAMSFNNDYAQRLDKTEQIMELIEEVMKDSQIEFDNRGE